MSQNSLRTPPNLIATIGAKARQDVAAASHERLRKPLRITFRQRATGPANQAGEASPQVQNTAAWKSARIAVKSNGRIVLIDPAEILVAEAQGNYVLLQQCQGSHLLREQISVLEEKLRPFGLVRIHRSVLVNAALVEGMEPLLTGEYLLRMKGGKEYKVTRTYKKNLQTFASTWIGSEGFGQD